MNYEWNETKRARNKALHGLDFADVGTLEWYADLTYDQVRDGELRHLSYVPLREDLYAVVWTQRGEAIRIISFRKANNRERRTYEEA